MRVLVAYASLSGNTEAVASAIAQAIQGHWVQVVDISRTHPGEDYDLMFLGTYTFDGVPAEVREFWQKHKDKARNVAIFGTGDTQWGTDYCLAAQIMNHHAGNQFAALAVEHNMFTRDTIEEWVTYVLEGVNYESE